VVQVPAGAPSSFEILYLSLELKSRHNITETKMPSENNRPFFIDTCTDVYIVMFPSKREGHLKRPSDVTRDYILLRMSD
jgi:hypothetical protein